MTQNNSLTNDALHVLKEAVIASNSVKAINPLAYNVTNLVDYTEGMLILTGRSDRHVKGIVNRIMEDLAKKDCKPLNIEGLNKCHWVLLDYDSLVIHVFYEPLREIYNLDELWDHAPLIELKGFLEDDSLEAA